MARLARVVVPGFPHHVTQRGSNCEGVFCVDGDRVTYLGLLREQCEKHGVAHNRRLSPVSLQLNRLGAPKSVRSGPSSRTGTATERAG